MENWYIYIYIYITVAEHWMCSCSIRTIPRHGRGEKYFTLFLSPHMKHGLSSTAVLAFYKIETPPPARRYSRVTAISHQLWQLWNLLQEPGLWKFRLALTTFVDIFTIFTSDPDLVWLAALLFVNVLFPHRKLNWILTNKNFKHFFLKIGMPTKVYLPSLPDQSQKSNTCRRCHPG
jgi:hypothetical protein